MNYVNALYFNLISYISIIIILKHEISQKRWKNLELVYLFYIENISE